MSVLSEVGVQDSAIDSVDGSRRSASVRLVGVVVMVVGAMAVAGWMSGIESLTCLIPGTTAMKANAAVAFILIGGALILSQTPGSWGRRMAQICSLLAGGISLLTLGEYALGWDTGVDEFLFRDPGTSAAAYPGRMAPNAAICMGLTATALWLMSRPPGSRQPRILAWLGALVLAIGLVAIIGYVVGFSAGYRWWNLTGMAIPTSLLFVLLGAAILCVACREGAMCWSIKPSLTVAFGCGLVLLVAVAALAHRSTRELVEADARVKHTQVVIAKIRALRSAFDESQSAMRGYVITGDESFLPLSERAIPEARRHLPELRALTADNTTQQARLFTLEQRTGEWLQVSKQMIDLRRAAGFEAAAEGIAAGRDQVLMNQIRGSLDALEDEEAALLVSREAGAGASHERTFAVMPVGVLGSALLVTLGVLLLNREVSRRQLGADALRESEAKFRALFENAGDAIFLLQGDQFIDCNARTLEMFGCQTRDQIVGHPPYEFSPPVQPGGRDSRESAIEKISAAMAGRPQFFEWMHTKLDGTAFPAEVSLNRVNLGSKASLQAIVRDITGRKQAEEALREAGQKMRLFFEQTPMAVIEWDLEFRVSHWNPAARAIFGFSPAEALGQHASFIVPESFHPHLAEIWQGLMQQRGGERSMNENVRKDGRTILCEWYNTALIDDCGTVTGAVSVAVDITERRRALQLLAWEKSALELVSSAAPLHEVLDGLMQGLEKQSPGALCSILLLDADGIHLRHGAAPSLPEAYNRLIDGVAIGPKVGSCGTAAFTDRQVIVEDIGSDPLWADYRDLAREHGLHACWSTPIHCGQGKILGTFAIYYRAPRRPDAAELELIARATHIAGIAIEHKQAEEQIHHLNASLEQRVRERTAQLEAAVKELDAFSYSVSHDLRAPLRAIDGFSRIVAKDYGDRLDDEGRRMLGVIRAGAQRMGRLIDDLLAFSRLGRQPLESSAIDMRALAQAVFDELAALEPERKLRLDLQPLPAAHGTEAMIQQVWVNLISNAIKFTKERVLGEIQIGARQGGNGEQIYFVKDNGAGFDMRYIDKLFGVFQRLHSMEEYPGTGVGLALVQRIVQRHGGRIWAEGEVDKGATFFFTLPSPPP